MFWTEYHTTLVTEISENCGDYFNSGQNMVSQRFEIGSGDTVAEPRLRRENDIILRTF